MGFEGFIFSEKTSLLNDQEYNHAIKLLSCIDLIIQERDQISDIKSGSKKILLPDEGWHPNSQPTFEIDGSTKNAQTSYALLAEGDRDIIRKLRLYGQAFTGYQLATLSFAENRPWLSRKLPSNWDEILSLLAGRPDQSVFDYVSVATALPKELRIRPPNKFGEIGWLYDGVIINDDVYSYLERICLMYENGLIGHLKEKQRVSKALKIIEIGGGFGGLAYYLINIFNEKVNYSIIDIPESLAFSSIYLSILFPRLFNKIMTHYDNSLLKNNSQLNFVPNFMSSEIELNDKPVDLVINTLSLSEMSDDQINNYCKLISYLIGNSGIFFEQNHQSNNSGPGGFLPKYFKNLKKCQSKILPNSYPHRRGNANFWVNSTYTG